VLDVFFANKAACTVTLQPRLICGLLALTEEFCVSKRSKADHQNDLELIHGSVIFCFKNKTFSPCGSLAKLKENHLRQLLDNKEGTVQLSTT